MSPIPHRAPQKHGPDRWKVRFRLDDGTQTSEMFDTRDAASGFCRDIADLGGDAARRLLEENLRHTTAPTLDELAEAFFDWKAKRTRSDRTVADYRRDYANWIKPRFGRRRANSISESEVQAWVDAMRDGDLEGRRPAAPKSIADRHALLHAIYKRALQTRAVDTDPCGNTDLPRKQKGLPKGLRPNEWATLHAALATISQDAADVAEALLVTGWRWSEIAALSVGQVEDDGRTLHVSMDRVVRRNAAGQHVIVDEGKGQASVRRVQVDEAAVPMFRRHLVGKGIGDLVFTTPVSPQNGLGGGQWHYSNFLNRYWNPAVKAANLARRPTPHWLRHTHVVWMAMAGANLPELQARIGHASITTTINVYGRMLSDVSPTTLSGFAAMRAVKPAAQQVLEGSVVDEA